MTFLVLNQYRKGSGYKDVVGQLYHFPDRYSKAFSDLPVRFVYYEPRSGGDQLYFGAGEITHIYDDTEDVKHAYAEIGSYRAFPTPVNFFAGPNNASWEPAKTMRNSARKISPQLYRNLIIAGGLSYGEAVARERIASLHEVLQIELASFRPPGKRPPYVLRRIERILETYERPSAITNQVKRVRGDACQLCGSRGFLKRDGKRYSEVHHVFHLALSAEPPEDALQPEYLVVLCATCHRRMHYAHVGIPKREDQGWSMTVDGQEVFFRTA